MESRPRNVKNGLAIFGVASTFLLACTTITPHENFKAHLNAALSRSVDVDPALSLCSQKQKNLIEEKLLPNGNMESRHFLRYGWTGGICTYFCEFDSVTRKIVHVRFEGVEENCGIPP
ncbi:MAG: hypothetical protein M3A44_05115 [Gammaproteobacteria bacterium]